MGCTIAAYVVGTHVGRTYQRARLRTKAAAIHAALGARPLYWRLEDADGRVQDTATPTATWKILLVGADGCDICTRQQLAFMKLHRATRTSAELWIASTRVALFDAGNSDSPQGTLRSFRYLDSGALQAYMETLPLLLLLDPNGIVRDVTVGYSEQREQEVWERVHRAMKGA